MSFDQTAIALNTLNHTGRVDGDDAGYRDIPVEENGERLEYLDPWVKVYPVYALGARKGLCPYYGSGLNASYRLMARNSVTHGLLQANYLLKDYNRELVVLDAWRSLGVQAALWVNLLRRILVREQLMLSDLSVYQLVKFGLEADEIGAYSPVQVDSDEYRTYYCTACDTITTWEQVAEAATKLGMMPEEVLHLWMTFDANLTNGESVPFDENGNTSHGAGGATDLYLMDTLTGQFTCLGVPFDYTGPAAAMDYFEDDRNRGPFYELVCSESDPMLSRYIRECGFKTFGNAEWEEVRRERRILYHACTLAGASIYHLESWHFNWGNPQAKFPGAGGSCHSLLKDIRDQNGNHVAVWGNAEAHRQARELLAA